jgi:hypothetical protein
MAEQTYMGYVSPTTEGVDWAGLSSQLSTKLKTVETERQAERDALDKISLDNTTLVNSYTPGKDQTLNEMIMRGMDDAKTKITSWNKELKEGRLKPNDYKIRMNNLKENWGTLASNAKNYDQRISDVVARQQDGTAGVVEAELLRNWTDATDVKSNAVVVSDDGRVYTSKFDRNTGQPTGQVADMRLLSLPDNIMSNKVDLATQIESYTADWQPETIFSADPNNPNIEITSESVMNRKDYNLMKDKVANAIAPDSNPRAQVSVLGDNGAFDVNFYYTDEEYNKKYDELFAELEADKSVLGEEITEDDLNNIDMSLVKMDVDENNMYNPVLTDGQKKAVKDFISSQIDMRTENKITKGKSLEYQIDLEQKKFEESKKKKTASTSSSSKGPTKTEVVDAQAARELKSVFNRKTVAAANVINDYLDSGYKVVLLTNGSYKLKKLQAAGEALSAGGQAGQADMSKSEYVDVKTFTTFDGLNPYISWSTARDAIKTGSTIGGELD